MKKGRTAIKRAIAGVLTLMLVVSMLPTHIPARAAEEVETGGSLTITGDTEVIIGSSGIKLSAAKSGTAGTVGKPEKTSTTKEVVVTYEQYENAVIGSTYKTEGELTTEWTWGSGNTYGNTYAVTLSAETSTVTVTAKEKASDVKITATMEETETYWVVTDKYYAPEEKGSGDEGSTGEGSTEEGSTDEDTTETTYYLTLQKTTQTTTYTGTYTVSTVYDTLESITLNYTELTLNLVNTTTNTLTATLKGANGGTVDPDTKITWESSNNKVATVNDGTVTAKGIGTATITASVEDISATCAVTVEKVQENESGSDVKVTYGDTYDLNVDTKGYNSVEYVSSNTDCVTVDDKGTIKGVGVGENSTTVTVTLSRTSGNNDVIYTKTITFNVTVTKKELTVIYDNTVITKESDGNTDVTSGNQNVIDNALSIKDGVLDGDTVGVKVAANGYGKYSSYDVGECTITVTVELTGEDAGNYTLSSDTVKLNAKITAATPKNATLNLTAVTDDEAELELSDSESITFVKPTENVNDVLWFADEDDKLTLDDTSAESYTLYTDETCKTEFDGNMTEGTNQEQKLYVKTSDGVVYGPITVTYNYDITAPVVDVSSVTCDANTGSIDFSKEDLTYTVGITDNASGVNKNTIYYYVGDGTETAADITDWKTPAQGSIKDDGEDNYSFTVSIPASGYLYVKVSDNVGNVTSEAVNQPLVIEANAPTVTVTPEDTVTDAANTHSFTVEATDEADDGYYSGIASITLTLTGKDANGNDVSKTTTKTYDAPTKYADLEEAVEPVVVTIPDYFSGVSSGTYTLTVTATDFCGNTSDEVKVEEIVIDVVAPTATLTMNGKTYGDVDGDGTYYYNADNAGFTVTIDDYTISQDVTYTITAKDKNENEVEKTGTVTEKSDITFTAADLTSKLTDGTITVTVSVTDAAGNATEALTSADGIEAKVSDMTFTFVLDTTAPTLEGVKLTGGNYVSDDSAVYYNDDFEAVYTITETNLYEDKVVLGGETPTGSGAMGDAAVMSIENDDATATVTVSVTGKDDVENSVYRPTVTVTDKAGNKMVLSDSAAVTYGDAAVEDGKASLSAALVLDTVAPVLESVSSTASDNYYDDESRVYYNSAFEITWQVTEVNYAKTATWTVSHTGDGSDATTNVNVSGSSITFTAKVARQSNVESAVYRPSLKVVDKAGNAMVLSSGSYSGNDYDTVTVSGGKATAENRYVLDTAAPEFTLKFNRTPSDTELYSDSYVYFNKTFNATFTVTDDNLDSDQIKVAAAYSGKTPYDEVSLSWAGTSTQNTTVSNGTWKWTLQAAKDGVYRFEVEAVDRAGNKLVQSDESNVAGYLTTVANGSGRFWTAYSLVVDTVAPVLNVSIQDGGGVFYTAKLNGGYNETESKPYQSYSSAVVTLSREDDAPTTVSYNLVSTVSDQSKSSTNSYGYGDITLNMNGQQVFYINKLTITDRSGNVSSMSGGSSKLYLDTEAPDVDEFAPTIAVEAVTTAAVRGDTGTDLFSSSVTVRATITDPHESVSSSGLYRVYYKVLVNGDDWTSRVSVSGKNSSVVSSGVLGYNTSGSGYDSATGDNETITSSDVIDFVFDENTFNYNDVKVYVWAEDNTGNAIQEANAAYYHFGIDVTAPTISVSYDNNDAQNEKYFNADRIATVTVTERNFDPDHTTISTEAGAVISGWSYTAGSSANGDDDTWTCTVTYGADGDYTFDVTTTDLVGHQAGAVDYGASVAPTEFTVDETTPIIYVVFDNNDVHNGKYYNALRTATITIDEHNFSTDGVTVVTTASLNGSAFAAPTEGVWTTSGDNNSTQVGFLTDGDYTMEVTFTDLAGNVAEVVTIDEFTVDTTAPELEISGVEDQMAYNGTVAPSITYSDINYALGSADITIIGYNGKTDISSIGVLSETDTGGSLVCDNIEVKKSNDDIYTVTATVSDLAGNVTEVSLVFSVNRFGSNFYYGDETEVLVDNYNSGVYINTPTQVHVYEINCAQQSSNKVTTSLNGELTTLTEGVDYTVTESTPGWYRYDYVISADALSAEGVYDITFTSEDVAGNSNSNRSVKGDDGDTSDVPVTFVLDMTAPVNIITGVENNSQYVAATRTIVINYEDNIGLSSLTLYFYDDNGTLLWTEPIEDFNPSGGSYEYELEARDEWQTVKAISVDKAGNVSGDSNVSGNSDVSGDSTDASSVDTVRVLLTSNILIQYYNNTPLFIGSIILLLLLLFFIFFLIFKRRKKDEDEEAQGTGAGVR